MKQWPAWVKVLIPLEVLLVILIFLGLALVGNLELLKKEATSQPVITSSPTAQTPVLDLNEEKQLYQEARNYVKKNSDQDLEFEMDLKNIYQQYALLQVIPVNKEIDPAQIVLEKKNGVWQAQAFGTSFPDWYAKAPQLFN